MQGSQPSQQTSEKGLLHNCVIADLHPLGFIFEAHACIFLLQND